MALITIGAIFMINWRCNMLLKYIKLLNLEDFKKLKFIKQNE